MKRPRYLFVALLFAHRADMRGRKKLPALQLLGIYLFAAFIGLLGGRIVTAGRVYAELGWTAMWAEVGAWSTSAQPKQIRVDSYGSGRS